MVRTYCLKITKTFNWSKLITVSIFIICLYIVYFYYVITNYIKKAIQHFLYFNSLLFWVFLHWLLLIILKSYDCSYLNNLVLLLIMRRQKLSWRIIFNSFQLIKYIVIVVCLLNVFVFFFNIMLLGSLLVMKNY